MSESESIRLSKFKLDCDRVKYAHIRVDEPLGSSPNRMIGYAEYIDVFRSLTPLVSYAKDGSVSDWVDFPEIFPDVFPTEHATGSAVLLTGETGCGRHTADKTLMSVVLDVVRTQADKDAALDDILYGMAEEIKLEDHLRFYVMDLRCLSGAADRALMRETDALFDQMTDAAVKEPSVLFYFSLGDITHILNSQRAAQRFLYRLDSLIHDPRALCIVTCVYNGRASTLSELYKASFYVLEFMPPEEKAREEYFRFLTERYLNITFDCSANELAKMTEGFTFAQIKKLAAHIMMTVKSEIIKKNLNPENYIRHATINQFEMILVDKATVNRLVNQIKSTRYIAPKPQAPAVMVSAAGAAIPTPTVVESNDTPQPEAPPKPPINIKAASGDELDDQVSDILKNIDKPQDIADIRKAMITPTGYSPALLMEKGRINRQVLQKESISLKRFLTVCWESGFTDLANVRSAYIDASSDYGIGFRAVDSSLVLEPSKVKLKQEGESLFGEVIVEGELREDALHNSGHSTDWLTQQLFRQGCTRPKSIFLAVIDKDDRLIIY